MNNCECCNTELEAHESDLLDCGHYACNSCTYTEEGKSRLETFCEKCHHWLVASKKLEEKDEQA